MPVPYTYVVADAELLLGGVAAKALAEAGPIAARAGLLPCITPMTDGTSNVANNGPESMEPLFCTFSVYVDAVSNLIFEGPKISTETFEIPPWMISNAAARDAVLPSGFAT